MSSFETKLLSSNYNLSTGFFHKDISDDVGKRYSIAIEKIDDDYTAIIRLLTAEGTKLSLKIENCNCHTVTSLEEIAEKMWKSLDCHYLKIN